MATSRSSRPVASFDRFEVDLTTGDLRSEDGEVVRIQQLPLQVLRLLLDAGGSAVTRDELRQALWPGQTFVDFEHGVNTAVKKLRQALGDSIENPKFIETLPKVGYRFLVPVEWSPVSDPVAQAPRPKLIQLSPEPPAPVASSKRFEIRRTAIAVSVVLAVLLCLAGATFRVMQNVASRRHPDGLTLVQEQRLTTNPEDTPVTSGLISPDGKYLAYTDATGFYLRLVSNGETHAVSLEKGFDPLSESWFPDGIHLVVSRVEDPQRQPSLWEMSVFGGPARKLTDAGYGASVSPDGTQILFLRQSGSSEEIWLMLTDALSTRRITASHEYTFSQLAWAADGKRFAYARTKTRYYTMRSGPDTQIEIFDLGTQKVTVVQYAGERGLPRGGAAVGWLPDGRLIYPVREPRPNQQDTNLWSVLIDPQSSQPIGPATRLTSGNGIAVQLSISADGKRIAFRRHAPQTDIFLAEIRASGTELTMPQRLTLDARNDNAMAWTADSKAIIFYSNRDGPWHVFKQGIQSNQAELLVGGPDDLYAPRMTPDGKSVIYIVRPRRGASSDDALLMRVPVEGGIPQLILKAPGLWDAECARLPSHFCIYAQIVGGHQSFHTFDPDTGNSDEYRAAERAGFNWILSPDGKSLAWATSLDSPDRFGIRSLNLASGKTRDLPVPEWTDLFGVDWAPNSKGLWLAVRKSGGSSAILRVQPNGKVNNVLNAKNRDFYWTIPSPDGRRLAIVQEMNSSNVSILQNF
jgi:Tol biopolymer transport system component/DNA-binding winged helix-turn-helix (wHTH) protein